MQAEETRVLGVFNLEGQYTQYERLFSETTRYDFFDSNSVIDNHGFDKDEWPFNWNGALIFGVGYETKLFYFSLRYSLGLFDFFRELSEKDDDFFDNYNTEVDLNTYNSFIITEPIINNNFKLRSISFTVGCHLSN
jgi:hypothetical protein